MRTEPVVTCVLGPTASGKSDFAVALATACPAEIVSADSMQVYRGMDIGTAKLDLSSCPIVHHCIDILEPDAAYSAALYQVDARRAIEDIHARGLRCVMCGGTMLYVRAALDVMAFAEGVQEGNEVRREFEQLVFERGGQAAYDMLEERDPASAALIHPHNTKRVVRALEMHARGESYAARKHAFKEVNPHYRRLKLGLSIPRDELYQRIDSRVEKMFASGLLFEVQRLCDAYPMLSKTAREAIGYRECLEVLAGSLDEHAAVEAVKQNTRRYAKRQLVWLRGDDEVVWVDPHEPDALERCVELVEQGCDGEMLASRGMSGIGGASPC